MAWKSFYLKANFECEDCGDEWDSRMALLEPGEMVMISHRCKPSRKEGGEAK